MGDITLILASGSPRRRQFMELLASTLPNIYYGVNPRKKPRAYPTKEHWWSTRPYLVIPSVDVDEIPWQNEHPHDLVQRLSRLKAEAVLHQLDDNPLLPVVIAADTVVALGQRILGKPASPHEAKQMLRALRQEPHTVYSGLSVALPSPTLQALELPATAGLLTRVHQSIVTMRAYSDEEIETYIASGDPLDKAGAYGIQTESFAPVAALNGCFASVMGFPIAEFLQLLSELGLSCPPIVSLCHQFTGQACCCE